MIKFLNDEDVVITISPFKEIVRLTSSIFSGSDYYKSNIINPTNGWTSGSASGSVYSVIYDRPTTYNYKNKLLTLSYGYSTGSGMYSGSFVGQQRVQKNQIYQLFAKQLLGNKNNIFKFDGQEKHELIFLSMCRNLYKDSISDDGNILIEVVQSGAFQGTKSLNSLTSQGNHTEYPGGKAVVLRESFSGTVAGMCFLESGIFAIDPNQAIGTSSGDFNYWSGTLGYEELAKGVSGSNLNDLLFGITQRIFNVQFYNESKIRSTFIRCSGDKSEFNYSSNPSFLYPNGKIRTASGSTENISPSTYITTIGFYNENNELLAVGKIPNPIKKDFNTEIEVVCRITY